MGEVVGVYDGTHQTPNYQDHGIMFVSVEDIQTLTSEKYISEEDYEKNYSVVPEQGDIMMTRIGDIGTANIVKSVEPLAYYVSLALLKNNGVNSEFLKANISAPAFQNELWLRTLHTAYPKKINKEEIGKCMISIAPSDDEQEQIGAFFENLDNLITLHQHKLDVFKKYKRGLIFQLYPLKDQSIPRIRIKGFKDPWTKIRLCDVLDEFVIKTSKENEYEVLSSTNIGMEFRKGRVSGTSNKGYKIIDMNDLVLSPQNLWLGNININHLAKGIVSPSYKTYKIHDIDIDFFEPILHTKEMLNNYAQSSVQGASVVRRNLDINLFNTIEISVPSKEEQTAIGKMLKSVDKLIIGLEKELELIIEYKRALISKMFI